MPNVSKCTCIPIIFNQKLNDIELIGNYVNFDTIQEITYHSVCDVACATLSLSW